MEIQIGDSRVSVDFTYWPTQELRDEKGKVTRPAHSRGGLTCFVRAARGKDDPHPSTWSGYTTNCTASYCRENHRKIALATALKKSNFTRDERRQIWNAYHDRVFFKHAPKPSWSERLCRYFGFHNPEFVGYMIAE